MLRQLSSPKADRGHIDFATADFLPKNSTEIQRISTEILHFAAHFYVQSRSLTTDVNCNTSRVIKPMQLRTSLGAVRNLTYLFKSGLIHKGVIKEYIKRN